MVKNYDQSVEINHNASWPYNPPKERRVLIVFGDMIEDMESNKKLGPTVSELFLWGRKLNILLVFISQSYFRVPKSMTKCNTLFYHSFPNKRELQ